MLVHAPMYCRLNPLGVSLLISIYLDPITCPDVRASAKETLIEDILLRDGDFDFLSVEHRSQIKQIMLEPAD